MPERILVVAGLAQSLVNFRLQLLKAFMAEGHEVQCAAPGLTPDSRAGKELFDLGIAIHDIPLERTGLNPLADIRAYRSLVRLCRKIEPTHLFAYTIKPVIYGMLAAKKAGVPHRTALMTGLGYAFTGEASGKRAMVQRLARGLLKSGLARSAAIIFQNPDDAGLFDELGLLPDDTPVTIVSGSGVDLEEFPPAPIPDGPPTFLLVARLLTAKGIREYAEAAAQLKMDYPDARFLLVGPHDSNPDAIEQQELDRWQKAGALEWLGPSDDVRAHLAASHVYVLPSYREGTPRSTLEAMATGRAVITTDAPGCRETVIEGENGLLVLVGDSAALATAMRRMLEEPGLIEEMGAASLDIARKRYDVHRVNADMLQAMGLDR